MRVLVVSVVLAVAATLQQAAPPSTATVEGRVVDANGRSLDGVVVRMNYVTSERMPAVITGSDGRFRLAGLPPGTRQIQAQKAGYLPSGYGQMRPGGGMLSLPLAAGQRVAGITITMWPPAVIAGRVLDEHDEPRAGVSVSAVSIRSLAESTYSGQPVGPMTQTNDRGEYELSVVPGPYAIVVPVNFVTWPIGTWADRNPMVIQTTPPTRIGTIVSPDGRFAVGLGNGLEPPPPAANGRAQTYVTTFHPRATAMTGATVLEVAAGDARTNVDIHLVPQPRMTISGRAEGPSGPLAQVMIQLQPDPKLLPMRLGTPQVTSQDDGTFEFMSVPPGVYRLVARRELRDSDVIRSDTEGLNASIPLPVDKDITDLVVTLRPGILVNGLIGTDGSTFPATERVNARLESLDERYRIGGVTQPTPVDQFAITGVRPGRYVVKANTPPGWFLKSAVASGRDVSDEPLDIGEVNVGGIIITLTDRPNEITGSISTVDGASPREGAVVLFPVDPAMRVSVDQFTRRVVAVRPDTDGTYLFRNIPPGDYCIYALMESRMVDWPDPRFLDSLAQRAPHIPIAWNEHRAINLFLSMQK